MAKQNRKTLTVLRVVQRLTSDGASGHWTSNLSEGSAVTLVLRSSDFCCNAASELTAIRLGAHAQIRHAQSPIKSEMPGSAGHFETHSNTR
ncbi:hypothetical protein ACFQS6_21065 [Xanthomonas populi]